MSLEEQTKTKMKQVVEHFKSELKSLRSNRANPSVLDGVLVEVYGTMMRLKELANVTAPEPRQLLITPFDPRNAPAVAKGVEKANLNLQPVVDGHAVRINIPPMDENMRKEIVKVGKKKAEDTKIALRDVRKKQNDLLKKQKTDGEITEDQFKKGEKTIQDLTDKSCKEVDELFTAKEKEILTV